MQYSPAFLHSISNVDGSMSIFHVDPNNPIITLPDGTQAHVQGVVSTIKKIKHEFNFIDQ